MFRPVCADGFNISSAVSICSVFGHGNARAEEVQWRLQESAQGQHEFSLRRLVCGAGSNSNIACAYQPGDVCTSESVVFLRCAAREQPAADWQFALGSGSIFNGVPSRVPRSNSPWGSVLVRRDSNATTSWGVLSLGSAFNSDVNANREFVCYMLGFGLATGWTRSTSYSCCYSRLPDGDRLFPMGELDCLNRATSLSRCTYNAPANKRALQSIDCGSYD